jgi:signal transduction histidine kinase
MRQTKRQVGTIFRTIRWLKIFSLSNRRVPANSQWRFNTVQYLAVLICLLLCAALPSAAAGSEVQRVLVIFTESRLNPGMIEFDDEIRRTLQQKERNPEIFVEFLDTIRFADKAYEDALVASMRQKYSSVQPDLIIAVREFSLKFLLRHRDKLFSNTIIVHAGVPIAEAEKLNSKDGIIGIPVNIDLFETLNLALQLHPHSRHVVVINGASPPERGDAEALRRLESDWRRRSSIVAALSPFEFWSAWSMEDVLSCLAALPKDTIVLTPGIQQDSTGQWFVPRDAIQRFSQVSTAPIYVRYSSQVGVGAVGAYSPTFRLMASTAGKIALQLLDGESQSSLRLPPILPNSYIFDGRQLHRWGIRESQLPQGSIVLYKEPSAWERYRWLIATAAAVLILQTTLIIALLIHRRLRRRAEKASQQAKAESQVLKEELAHTSRVMVMGEMSGALAHELNQPLTAILSNAEAAMQLLDAEAADLREVKEMLGDIVIEDKRASETIQKLRAMLKKRATQFQLLDLNEIAKEVIDLLRSDLVARHTTVLTRFATAIPAIYGDRIQLQQIVLNIVRNACEAMSKGDARERELTISTFFDDEDKIARISISDSGSGIPASKLERVFEPFFTTKPDGLGIGLPICRTIIAQHHGRMWAVNNPDRGVTFHVTLPVQVARGASA